MISALLVNEARRRDEAEERVHERRLDARNLRVERRIGRELTLEESRALNAARLECDWLWLRAFVLRNNGGRLVRRTIRGRSYLMGERL